VAEKQSEEFPKLLAAFLKPSDNLYGECLLKALGAEKGGAGTTEAGAKVVRDFLKEAGIDTGGLYIADGSGLSRFDNVTPRLLVDLLTNIDRRFPADAKQALQDALPVAGLDGTLRNRFKRTLVEGNLRAKTGSLRGVSALSGYLTASSGERFVFSLLLNHFQGAGSTTAARTAQDAFTLALAAQRKP
jgi:D-alanyl-D-alanine carboxypeptidase/D-alanyl-D-alanine-endopeptidase (penicillin-binding protein 4)